MSDLNNIIVLQDDEGGDVEFEFLDLIEWEESEYVVLLPVEDDDSGLPEVVILRIEETDEDEIEVYSSVDDEALLMRLFEVFKSRFKDTFDFID
ncbi:MAG: DUF1292 domain-containing protein [Coriobacteriales bacterium]|nr:DUF1292 domain-containing protein [Coriobacteriales bacterium]